jgi:hypothetical protein
MVMAIEIKDANKINLDEAVDRFSKVITRKYKLK